MATNKKSKHGSGKVYKPKPVRYDPRWTNKVTTDELREALKSALTLPQLAALEKQIEHLVQGQAEQAMITAYKSMWAIALRVLHDRFGFDAADAPSKNTEPVYHNCVAISPNHAVRIGYRSAIFHRSCHDNTTEKFKVNLVNDSY